MLNTAEMNRLAELHKQVRQGFGLTPEERQEKRRLEDKATAEQLDQVPFTVKGT